MATDDRLTGKRILVVEDEYFIASDLKRALAGAGAEVVGPVGALAPAEDLVERDGIVAAVLDVNLEGEHSYSLVDTLLADDVPVLLVTGYDDWALPEKYRGLPRLTKPFALDRVARQVAEMLSQEDAS
jgi:DNA-binding NtrC family response regulator